jgi:alkanesulfonate monooxygenase SsuD/methylene tetrahydromethanopterin reductase-like flavin-dependent oxidoreductase (luciferase family)
MRPFAPGSVSLRLYPHNELEDASDVIRELCDQAKLGLDGGFDGIMVSEHHGGWPGYLPLPLQMTTFILEENERGWAAPCPLLLPLRPTAMVAEEIAWLDARHPGRVGLGVGSGAVKIDFDAMGVPLEEASARFKAELPRVIDMLKGKNLAGLDLDRAFQRCARHPIPVLSAAVSPTACRRAARLGAGILLEGMSTTERLAELCRSFDEAGGTEPKVLIRRVWLGTPDKNLIERQRAVYASSSGTVAARRPMADDQTVSCDDPAEMAERLHAVMKATGGDAINLRVHLPDYPREAIRGQISVLAEQVVPKLRSLLA